ncbi:hypothetical protein Tco_0668248 [Tanacetum coccineum]
MASLGTHNDHTEFGMLSSRYLLLVLEAGDNMIAVAPTTLSFQKAPIDKVPVLQVKHRVSDRFEILLVESKEDPASPLGINQENLKLSVHPQVASSLTYEPRIPGCFRHRERLEFHFPGDTNYLLCTNNDSLVPCQPIHPDYSVKAIEFYEN